MSKVLLFIFISEFISFMSGSVLSWVSKSSSIVISKPLFGSITTVTFTEALSTPMTLSSSTPFQRKNGKISKFSVKLTKKNQRTAIGFQFSNPPSTNYLTPSYDPSNANYISMGGAGFVYPTSKMSKGRYGENDEISLSLDWTNAQVQFKVNDRIVATEPISSTYEVAFPSISTEGGGVVCQLVTTEETAGKEEL